MFKIALKIMVVLVGGYYIWLVFFVVPQVANDGIKECYQDRYEYKAYCECAFQPMHEHKFLFVNAIIADTFGNEHSSSLMKLQRKMKQQEEVCKPYLPAKSQLGEAFVDWLIDVFK